MFLLDQLVWESFAWGILLFGFFLSGTAWPGHVDFDH